MSPSSPQQASHSTSQHYGSIAQIVSQHSWLSQNGVPFASQQLPCPGQDGGWQPGRSGQSFHAKSAHSWSHTSSQQCGSTAQTDSQQEALLQYGVSVGAQQLPAPPLPQPPQSSTQAWNASHAQFAFH
jgi:hypothetical protein